MKSQIHSGSKRERESEGERERIKQTERERERTEPYRTCKKLFLGPTPQVEVVWVPGMHCWYVSVSLQSTFKMVPKMPSLTLSMYCTHKIVNIHQSFLSKKTVFNSNIKVHLSHVSLSGLWNSGSQDTSVFPVETL